MADVLRIAIATRNRPQLLSRLVDSVVADVAISDCCIELLVADQSDSNAEARNAACLQAAAARVNGQVFHLGHRARTAVLETAPAIASRLGLCRPGHQYGNNRNWISLFFAGDPYASFDDDTVLAHVRPRTLLDADDRNAESVPWSFYAYSSRADLMSALDGAPGHASVVADMLDALQHVEVPCTEAFALPGVAGHSGLGTHALLADTGCEATLRRLLASDQAFVTALDSTNVVRQATRRRVYLIASLVATAFAVRNREGTFPYLQWGRGEDHVFCRMLRACGQPPLAVSLDFSVFHFPGHGRGPARTIEVTGIASIATAFLDMFGDCESPQHLAAIMERVVGGPDSQSALQRMVQAHAQRQMNYCADIATRASACPAAFAAIERILLQWQALAVLCRHGDPTGGLDRDLHKAAEAIADLASLTNSWPLLWSWFLGNRALLRRATRIVAPTRRSAAAGTAA